MRPKKNNTKKLVSRFSLFGLIMESKIHLRLKHDTGRKSTEAGRLFINPPKNICNADRYSRLRSDAGNFTHISLFTSPKHLF